MIKTKKALSEIVANLLIVLIVVSAIGVLWVVFKNSSTNLSPELECSGFSLSNDVSVVKACYLDNRYSEMAVTIKRNPDNYNLSGFMIGFSNVSGGNVKFALRKKQCADIRLLSQDYGRDCDIINAGETKDYVFNLTGEGRMDSLNYGFYLGLNKNFCPIDKFPVSGLC